MCEQIVTELLSIGSGETQNDTEGDSESDNEPVELDEELAEATCTTSQADMKLPM